ncbi:hypothetical protein ACRAWD_20245 [Caulobacter segnis]
MVATNAEARRGRMPAAGDDGPGRPVARHPPAHTPFDGERGGSPPPRARSTWARTAGRIA